METYPQNLKQKLFDLMRYYCGAEYALAEFKEVSSLRVSSNGQFVLTNAPKLIDLIGEVLRRVGYQIQPFTQNKDGEFTLYSNQPKDMGGILRDGAGQIAFKHLQDELTMVVGEQARFASDRLLPDSWPYLYNDKKSLCTDQSIVALVKEHPMP